MNKLLLTGALIAATLAPVAAQAQDQRNDRDRQERHDDRSDARQDRREDRRDMRQDHRQDRREDRRDFHNDRRDFRHDRRDDHQSYRAPYRGQGWRAPFAYHSFGVGAVAPRNYWGSQYYVNDWQRMRLPRPGVGYYRYVRHYGDLLLLNTRNGRVIRVYRDYYR